MKQPALGTASLFLIIFISLGIIGLFEETTFSTWVSFLLMCMVPTQILMAMVWQSSYPNFLQSMRQPVKGLVMTVMTVGIGGCAACFAYFVVGKGHGITPMLMMYIIFSIVLVFWFAALWQCWPVALFTQNPLIIGASLLLIAYLGGYTLFVLLFDFSFLQGAPVYFADADPGGMFMAWTPLVFAVTSVATIMMFPLFEGWPVRAIENPTLRAAASSAIVVAIAAAIYWLATSVLGVDQVFFMVFVPVSFIFGTFLPLTFFQGGLLSKMQQPLKGIALVILCAIAAYLLQTIYMYFAPLVSGPLASGPEGNYQRELWLANALLGLTFPLLVIMLDYFQFWPLVPQKKPEDQQIDASASPTFKGNR